MIKYILLLTMLCLPTVANAEVEFCEESIEVLEAMEPVRCCDGWISSCQVTRPGCCSHHGGVCG